MKARFLFVYAHPDDESFGAGATIYKLTRKKENEVFLLTATAGQVGKVSFDPDDRLTPEQVGEIRRRELKEASKVLGIKEHIILDYYDGELGNNDIWGDLTVDIRKVIEEYEPNFIITFDRTGWYFHLDHIAISLATSYAVNRANHTADAFLFNYFTTQHVINSQKAQYGSNITHLVKIDDVRDKKLEALHQHKSQITLKEKDFIKALGTNENIYEEFELVSDNGIGHELLRATGVFIENK